MTRKRKPILILLVALFLAADPAHGLEANLKGPGRLARKRLSTAVVQITVYDWRGIFVRQGWGFFINSQGHIVTPHSVLNGGSYVEVTTSSRETFRVDRILSEDAEGNLVRIALEATPDRFTYIDRSASFPDEGERVLVGGGQGCEPGAFLDGVVQDVRTVPVYGSLVRIGSPFATTGSPVFNESGVLVGMVLFRFEDVPGSAWAVPVGRIARLMVQEAAPVEYLAWAEKNYVQWEDTAVGSYMVGLASYWSGHYGRAISLLRRVREDKRFSQQAYFLLGFCHDALGKYESSAENYSMAVSLGMSSCEAFLRLSRALLRQGQPDQALHSCWAAIREQPGSYEAYCLLAEIYNMTGSHQDALAGVYVAIRIDPSRAEAYHLKGISHRGLKEYGPAVEALRKALDIDPGLGAAYWDLALTYYQSGDRQAAAEICRALEKLDPELSKQLMTEVSR